MNLKDKLKSQTEKKPGNSIYWKPSVGKNTVTILPISYDGEVPWKLFKQHYVDGKYSLCPGDGCKLCAEGWRFYNDNGKKMTEEAKKLLPQTKAALNIKVNGELKVWIISEKMLEEILDIDEGADGAIFEKTNGRDLVVSRSGDGILTRYNLSAALTTRTIEDYAEAMMNAPDLDDVIS